nr:unnamed protein product [Spirometra erinaceieuropaei]
MVSFDVVSLFTSIPQALAVETLSDLLRQNYDESDGQPTAQDLMELMGLCIKTFFTSEAITYEQTSCFSSFFSFSSSSSSSSSSSALKQQATLSSSVVIYFFSVKPTHVTACTRDLAIETVELLLQSKYDETENRLGHAQALQLLRLCLRTYFAFDGTIYEEVKGTPMGSTISGFIAEAVLQQLASLVFQHYRPKFLTTDLTIRTINLLLQSNYDERENFLRHAKSFNS